MKKSFKDIQEQRRRIEAACLQSGRYCNNAKKRLDIQHIAQMTRNALTQHGFPIFGEFDKEEKRPCKYIERRKIKQAASENEPPRRAKTTPTECAHARVAMTDWLASDEQNRKQLQDMCRHAFIKKMYAELLTDMEVCKIEEWDVLEFPRMLKQALQVCFPKPVQLKLFDI